MLQHATRPPPCSGYDIHTEHARHTQRSVARPVTFRSHYVQKGRKIACWGGVPNSLQASAVDAPPPAEILEIERTVGLVQVKQAIVILFCFCKVSSPGAIGIT